MRVHSYGYWRQVDHPSGTLSCHSVSGSFKAASPILSIKLINFSASSLSPGLNLTIASKIGYISFHFLPSPDFLFSHHFVVLSFMRLHFSLAALCSFIVFEAPRTASISSFRNFWSLGFSFGPTYSSGLE